METVKVIVHTFSLGDVDDPDIYAADPLWHWEKSEAGRWVMEHAVDTPVWHRFVDHTRYGYRYKITAELTAEDATFYNLKYRDHSNGKTMG